MAHYDVVPVAGQDWSRDPFSGLIEDGVVHGRGAIDDKGALVAILEAVESLVAAGFTPARDVYLSFGNDEEVFGVGAQLAVETLTSRGIRPWAVLDEGGAVVSGVFPGVPGHTAVVGLAEKGLLDVELVTTDAGGHASAPVRGGAPARLARAIPRIDDNPFPARLHDVVLGMVDALGRHAPTGTGRCSRTRSTCGPRWRGAVTGEPGGERTGPDDGGDHPARGEQGPERAGHPRPGPRQHPDRPRRDRRDDPGPAAPDHRRPRGGAAGRRRQRPLPVSRADNEAFALIGAAVRSVYPDAAVAPYVMVQASDSRHFSQVCDSVYRFMPFDLSRRSCRRCTPRTSGSPSPPCTGAPASSGT